MGIISKNKPATISATAPQSPTLDDRAADRFMDRSTFDGRGAPTDPAAILFASLPPPSACPTCHCPQRWLSRYAISSTAPPPPTAWQCEACNPPPLPALVVLRVLLVSVTADSPFATIDDVLGIPIDAPQWHRLQIHQTRNAAAGEKNWRRVATTAPVRCAANCNLLADDATGEVVGEVGEAGEGTAGGKSSGKGNAKLSPSQIFFDATLGKIFHYAEMDGAFGRDARPTGREFYRDVDEWFDERDPDDEGEVRFGLAGDWATIEREMANYEKFVKPKLGKRA